MSEAELEKSPEKIMNYLERAMINGWYRFAKMTNLLPWDDAYWGATEIERSINYYKSYSHPDLIDFLSRLSNIDYDTFKEMWDKLSPYQKFVVMDTVISNIALTGVSELFKWIAEKLSGTKYKEARAKVLQAARDYLNGKIDEIALMGKIADVLWPTLEYNAEDCDEFECYEYRAFMLATTLIKKYIHNEDFKELVKKYLVEGLGKQG